MIITDSTPKSPFKPKAPLPNNQGQGSGPAPPAYAPYPSYTEVSVPMQMQPRESPARRFIKAFAVAALICFLVSMLTSSMVSLGDRHGHGRWIQNNWPGHDDNVGMPLPSDGPAQRCVGGQDWSPLKVQYPSKYPETARVSFDLSTKSDTLYLLSRGVLSTGSVTIKDTSEGGDKVKVDIDVHYYTQEALNRANVCLLQRKLGENGVGIFTPERWNRISQQDRLQFEITVYLPLHDSHLSINNFETHLPNFAHTIEDLAKTVDFQRLSLKTSNMPISVKSIHAEHASLRSSNSPITGVFNTSTSLELKTSNAAIRASVGLRNDLSGVPTEAILTTSNGPIVAYVSLVSTKSYGGSFQVNTQTSNQPLSISYDASPVDSTLRHYAKTSNAPADVYLHSAYEGRFSLKTSNFRPSVNDRKAKDPSGEGRHRSLEVHVANRAQVSGEVYWGEERNGEGNIEMTTSNSPAQLYV